MWIVALALVAFAGWAWHAHSKSGGVRRGLAGGMDITTSVSTSAVRRNALVTRPTTRVTWRTPAHHCGIEIGRVRWLGVFKRTIYAGYRDIVLILAPPGAGKTGVLGGHVQDAPGAMFAASSRSDLYAKSKASRRLRPIWMFNPDDVGGVCGDDGVQLVKFSPVIGCADPEYASLIASYLVSGGSTSGMGDAEFWSDQAHRVLRCLLCAADLADYDMRTVVEWAGDLSPKNTQAAAILDRDTAPPGWATDLREIQNMPDKTRGSISTTISTAVKFMAIPRLAELATPARDEHFNVAEFLRTGASLYVIGKVREHDLVAPLFTALTGALFEAAVSIAERAQDGRLDPPLIAVLDEVTNIFRVPLDTWTSFSGGNGIPMVIAAQSRHQLRKAFGDNGEHIIWQTSTVKMAFGGDVDPETLNDLCTLAGERAAEIGSTATRHILTPRDITQLPDGQGARPRETLIFRRSVPPILSRPRMVWERRRPPVAEPLAQPTKSLQPGSNVVHLADRRAA